MSRRSAMALAAVLAAGGAVFAPSLDNGFSLDDFNWLERARFAEGLTTFALTPEPGQLLVPLPKTAFWLLQRGVGLTPLPYRLAFLALHLLNAWLVYRLGLRVLGDGRAAALAGVLFAAHTAGSEALFWVAAFFHLIVTTLFILVILSFLRGPTEGHPGHRGWALTLFTLGLLSKATFAPCLLVLAAAAWLYGDPSRSPARRLAPLVPFLAVAVLVLAVNWGLELGRSYLLARDAWRPGGHVASHLQEYLVRLALPWHRLPEELGLAGLGRTAETTLRWLLPPLVALGLARGSRELRFSLVFLLAALLPVLPFVGDPTSRYAYLPTAALALVAGHLISRGWRSLSKRKPSLHLVPAALLVGLLLALVAEARLEDRSYEHRERRFDVLVADAQRLCPVLPAAPEVVIVGLPTFAVDRGIHLAAALRLSYDRPRLRLRAVDSEPGRPPPQGDCVVAYREGRLEPASS